MKRFLILAFSLLFCVNMFAQQSVTVTGVVSDASNYPLVGVGVVQQGTTNGVITDIDGRYEIEVPAGSTLEFSCLGYNTVTRTAVAGTLDVTLEESTLSIEETVVVGYGVQKKSDLTGSISSVGADDLANRSITSVDNGLQGKTAGVQVVTTSGAPGAESSIRVRGYSSNSDSTPLYVVDGLRTQNIAYLDPSDIESIEVLKDAASAAIYGAQAGNGVVSTVRRQVTA